MFKYVQLLGLAALLAGGVMLVGCRKDAAPPDDAAVDEASPSDVSEAFAALSAEDQAAALAQKVCPVSDEELGSMGTPIKVTVEGRDVFICCQACRRPLLENPAQYLAKLDAE